MTSVRSGEISLLIRSVNREHAYAVAADLQRRLTDVWITDSGIWIESIGWDLYRISVKVLVATGELRDDAPVLVEFCMAHGLPADSVHIS